MADIPISRLPDHGNIKSGDEIPGNRNTPGGDTVTGRITYHQSQPLRVLVYHSENTSQGIVDAFNPRVVEDFSRTRYIESYISDFNIWFPAGRNLTDDEAAHFWPDTGPLYVTALTEQGHLRVTSISISPSAGDGGGYVVVEGGQSRDDLVRINGLLFNGYTITLPQADRTEYLTNLFSAIRTDSAYPLTVSLPV